MAMDFPMVGHTILIGAVIHIMVMAMAMATVTDIIIILTGKTIIMVIILAIIMEITTNRYIMDQEVLLQETEHRLPVMLSTEKEHPVHLMEHGHPLGPQRQEQ